MAPYPLPASRIERSVSPCVSRRDEAMERDESMRRVEAMRQCDEMRRDRSETENTAARIGPVGITGITPYSTGEYSTRHRNDTLDAGDS